MESIDPDMASRSHVASATFNSSFIPDSLCSTDNDTYRLKQGDWEPKLYLFTSGEHSPAWRELLRALGVVSSSNWHLPGWSEPQLVTACGSAREMISSSPKENLIKAT